MPGAARARSPCDEQDRVAGAAIVVRQIHPDDAT
jgi:hypothetical protein